MTTFSYTGGEQTYTVPAGVHSLSIAAVGAPGGGPQTGYPVAGRGALVSGIVDVTPGETFYVEVGGIGGLPAGGFNGGGSGGTVFLSEYGGGGASDVRTLPMSAGQISLNSRLIVAAGGGGSGAPGAPGGDAGQPGGSAGPASDAGGAGTQTAGGAGGCDGLMTGCGMAGGLGIGGDGGTSGTGGAQAREGSGGGGGLYGGGGGAGVLCTLPVGCSTGGGEVGGGGGGSSLVPSVMGTMQVASFATAPTVEIAPVPPPTCKNVTTRTPYGLAVSVQLTCTEFGGQPLTYAIAGAPAHGTLSALKAGGHVTVTYTPVAGFLGTDAFTYAASSTNGTSTTATVSITVTPRKIASAGHARRSETGATIPITCTAHGAAANQVCDVTLTMTVSQKSKTVTVGRTVVALGAGRNTVIISLNGRGRRLLAARGKLPVSLIVTQTVSATKSIVSQQRLVLDANHLGLPDVPINGTSSGTSALHQPGELATTHGAGRLSQLGQFTFSASWLSIPTGYSPPFTPYDLKGSITFVAANGDQLFGTLTGTGVFDGGTNTAHGTNVVTFTGGTGRFARASGALTEHYTYLIVKVSGGIETDSFNFTSMYGEINYDSKQPGR